MPKRAFTRKNGLLSDSYEDPPGKRCTFQAPATTLGESPDRDDALSKAAGDDGPDVFEASLALQRDTTAEHLESLLVGLAKGSSAAPGALLRFLDDPRVRPALVSAAERAPDDRLANFVQAVGIAGGDGALRVLRSRLDRLTANPSVDADDPHFNSLAGAMVSTAHAILRLDTDEEAAARAITRVFVHPCAFNRHSAIRNAAEVYSPRSRTRAMSLLRNGHASVLATGSPQELSAAGPALIAIDPDGFLRRCETLLASEQTAADERDSMISTLSRLDAGHHGLRAVGLAVRFFPRISSLHRGMGTAISLAPILPHEVLADFVTRCLSDDSPSLRLHVAEHLLPAMPSSVSRGFASLALREEPDPGLRRLFERLNASGESEDPTTIG